MPKIIFILISLVVFLLPTNLAYANGANVSQCPNDLTGLIPDGPPITAINPTGKESDQCNDNDCYTQTFDNDTGALTLSCYKTDSQGQAVDLVTGTNQPGCIGSNCISSSGISCDPNSGSSGSGGILTAIGCVPTDPQALIKRALQFVIDASGGIALLVMIIGALGMVTSQGNPEALKSAQGRFSSAVIGLLFIIFAVFLLKIIGVDILAIPGFSP